MKITNAFASNEIFLYRIQTAEFLPDIKDGAFYEVTLTAISESEEMFLVAGNAKHFPLKPCIATPSEMIEVLGRYRIL